MKKQLFLLPIIISLSSLSCGTKRAIPNNVAFELDDINFSSRHSDLQNTLLNQEDPSTYIKIIFLISYKMMEKNLSLMF